MNSRAVGLTGNPMLQPVLQPSFTLQGLPPTFLAITRPHLVDKAKAQIITAKFIFREYSRTPEA